MHYPNLKEILGRLESSFRDGLLTPAHRVDNLTFVCLALPNPQGGQHYIQDHFDSMPADIQKQMRGRVKGDIVSGAKVLAIFDVWPPTVVLHDKTIDSSKAFFASKGVGVQ